MLTTTQKNNLVLSKLKPIGYNNLIVTLVNKS